LAKLKLGPIADEKPVRLTVELPAALHRDLVRYGEALGRESGTVAIDPVRLVAPMLTRFMATDRGFARASREAGETHHR
jgi:hypothetical protein